MIQLGERRPLVQKSNHVLSAALVMFLLVCGSVLVSAKMCQSPSKPAAVQVVVPPVVQTAPVVKPPLVHKKPIHKPKPAAQADVPMPTSPVARSLVPTAQPARVWDPQLP